MGYVILELLNIRGSLHPAQVVILEGSLLLLEDRGRRLPLFIGIVGYLIVHYD